MDFFTVLSILGFPVKQASGKFKEIKSSYNQPGWIESQKWKIFDFHYNNNGSYRNFVGKYPKSWDDVPVLDKSKFRDFGIGLLPDSKNATKYYNKRTSGSTGNPFSFNVDYLTHTLTWMLLSDRYNSAGITLNQLQARFYGTPLSFKSKMVEKSKDLLSNRVRFNTYNVSDDNLEKWIKIFSEKPFRYIYGYSHPIRMLAKYLAKKNIILKSICPTLVTCIVTSEMCSDDEQELIEKTFGVPVFNEYGSSEFGIIGFGANGKWILSDELIYTQILDDDGRDSQNSVPGNVTVTSLFCKGTPLIKYNIGDLATIVNSNEGRFLTDLQGRVEESAILPSGRKVAGDSVFFYVFKEFTKQCNIIKEYKVAQLSTTHFKIEIIAERDLDNRELAILRKLATGFLEPGVEININRVIVIERTRSGKFKQFSRQF